MGSGSPTGRVLGQDIILGDNFLAVNVVPVKGVAGSLQCLASQVTSFDIGKILAQYYIHNLRWL